MKAIVKTRPKHAELVDDVPIPKLRSGYILVRVVAVAVNPTDWKAIDYMAGEGATIGVGYAGIVEAVGDGVTKHFGKGDRICGFVHGANDSHPEDGTHAEYVLAKGKVQMHIPENISFEEAATLGGGLMTCGEALYQNLKLPTPPNKVRNPNTILIYGGSTSAGGFAIQYAALSGINVIATSSPHNFEHCKRLGASEVEDFNDPECGSIIRAYTDDKLTLALDCISIPASVKICEEALSSQGGDYHSLLISIKASRPGIRNHYSFAYTIFGEAFHKVCKEFAASQRDWEFAMEFMGLSEELLVEGKIKLHKPSVMREGLKGVLDGIDSLRRGEVSSEKLVYKVVNTP